MWKVFSLFDWQQNSKEKDVYCRIVRKRQQIVQVQKMMKKRSSTVETNNLCGCGCSSVFEDEH